MMRLENIKDRLRDWVIALFVRAIRGVSREEDREQALAWLENARSILASDASTKDKLFQLHASADSLKAGKAICHSVVEAVKNYKNSDLPIAVKVSLP